MINAAKKNRNFGFTLTETIVAVAIFSLIIITVYSTYALSRRSYLEGENLVEIIQNGRVVLERMSREIRQARKIVSGLPAERVNPPSEIKFQDGNIPAISESAIAQGGSLSAIVLASSASDKNDYYKNMFVEIVGGSGTGQIKKIFSYNGATKTAEIEGNWQIIPNSASVYKIESYFYYINYYLDSDNNNVYRKVLAYCFSGDSLSCVEPKHYVSFDAVPPTGQSLLEIILEQPRVVGEYITGLEFWGSRVINIFIALERNNKIINFRNEVFGRNL